MGGAFLTAGTLCPGLAEAKIREPATLAELARDADLIVTGRVRAVIPSLFSLPGALVLAAFVVVAERVLRRKRIALPPLIRDGLLLSLVLVFFGGLVVLTGPTRFHRRIAIVHVDRAISGSGGSWIPVWFRSNFVCDTTNLEVGSRYLLFLEERGIGYRMSWYDFSAWKQTPVGGFHCWRGPGSCGPHVEEDIVRELERLGR